MIPSGTLRRKALDPTLDVIALGHHEGMLFFNPSPEPDSIFELLPRIARPDCPDSRHLARLLIRAREINGEQGEQAKVVCGFLDSLATDLHDAEINGQARKAIGAQALARALRPHLRTVADADTVDSTVLAAIREVHRIAREVSREQLASPNLRHELGKRPSALLDEIVGGER